MVQGITPQQLQALQQSQAINFGQGNVCLLNQKAENDSFNGKTLLTLAGVAGAIIFRKNIAGFVGKHFPKVAEWCGKNISKPVMGFIKKHRTNCVVKTLLKAHSGFLKLENKCRNFVIGLFGKSNAGKSAADITYNYTGKLMDTTTSVTPDLSSIINSTHV